MNDSMRSILILLFFGINIQLFGQYQDDFEDETLGSKPDSFTPSFVGDTENFILVDESGDKQLRTNTGKLGASSEYYLSTPSTKISNTLWEFYVNLKFNPSGSNYVDVFLASDVADLKAVQNGYFVRIGDTEDWIAFHKISGGTTSAPLIKTAEKILNNSSSKPYKIRVTRDATGNWELSIDKDVTGAFSLIGTVTDAGVAASNHFGLLIKQSTASSPADNHFFDDLFVGDIPPPSIQSVSAISATEVDVKFSKSVSVATAQNVANYSINNGLAINSATRDATDHSLVHLVTSALAKGKNYTITINNVEDENGNAIETNSTADFKYVVTRTAQFGDIVITEIMADPEPAFLFPEREYVEIYNTSDDVISLDGVSFSDNSKVAQLPAINLNPASYLAISSTTGASEFSDTINIIGVSNFPSLTNDGELLFLKYNDELLFSIEYDKKWHSELVNEAGGVSLEMKDVTNPCAGAANWTSSVSFSKGTPGKENSITESVPDNFAPEISSAIAFASDSIRLDFSEKITPASASLAKLIFEPSLAVKEVYFDSSHPSSLFIVTTSPLEPSKPYTINISNVSDCGGNTIEGAKITFALPVQSQENEIKLSEVLFNPRPNGVDFVEVYNTSDKYISLKGWQLATMKGDTIDSKKVISTEELVLEPKSYLVFTKDANVLLTNYPQGKSEAFVEMSDLPSYPDKEGVVVLLDQNEVVKETFQYAEEYHYDLLKSVDGVSLERLSYDKPNTEGNWRSASSVVGYATPGYENSQSLTSGVPSGTVSISPKVFIPGNTGSGRDFTTINYELDQPGKFANVNIYDQAGRAIKNLAQGVLLSTTGFLRWDGDTDNGKMARMGYYLVIFEIYDIGGNSDLIKETVVVGRDF